MNEIFDIEKVADSVCSCDKCKRMCSHNRPCWGTPVDIKKIIDAGYADKLMLDWYTDDDNEDRNILIVAPAIVGSEEVLAPLLPRGRCALLSSDGLCTLHDKNLKPTEGRKALCTQNSNEAKRLHRELVNHWDTEIGRYIVEAWRKAIECDDEPGPSNYSILDYFSAMVGLTEN